MIHEAFHIFTVVEPLCPCKETMNVVPPGSKQNPITTHQGLSFARIIL